MTWTSVGSLGAAAGPKTGNFYLPFSFSRDVDVGAVVVLWFGWDSVWSVFSPREDIIRVEDSVGNWWSRLGDRSAHSCFAQCGAMTSLFISQLKYPIPTGATITGAVGYGGAPGLLECRVVSAWEFALPDGYGWAATGEGATVFEQGPGTGVSLTWTPGEVQEYLFLYGNAVEGPFDTDVYTDSAGFTPIDAAGTSGGVADSNVSLHGGWKIETNSTVTSSPTISPARDNTHVVVGVLPVFKSTTFPHTPIIDDFNRADESPLDGGIWVPGLDEAGPNESVTTGPSSPGTRVLQIISDEAAAGGAGLGDGAGGQATVIQYDCDDMEVYATYSVIPENAGGVHLFIHHRGATDDANASGWSLAFGLVGLQFTPTDWWGLRLGIQGNQGVPDGNTVWFEFPDRYGPQPGDVWRLGMQRFHKTNHLWIDTGAGWEWLAARRDLGGNTSGRLGLAIWDSISRVDDFGGGPTCFIVNMNWRYAQRHKSATRALVNQSDV